MADNKTLSQEVEALSGQITASLGFTNIAAGNPAATTDLKIKSNYGTVNAPKPSEETRLKNKTGPADQREIVSYRTREIDSVNSYNKIVYPPRVSSGQEFGLRLDELQRIQDENGFILSDNPIVVSVSWKATMTSSLNNQVLNEIWKRVQGAIPVDADGNYDWLSIALGSTNPLLQS